MTWGWVQLDEWTASLIFRPRGMDLFPSQDDELVPASAERITFQVNESGVLNVGYIQMSSNAYFCIT